ncbi:MAG: Flp pilus assembly protein CpaB [Anaerolineae bacterium]|nr:Flp pilus assembly protein CpaB [Anaerolineae bacterium]
MQRGRLLIILGVILGLLTLGAVVFLVVGSDLASSLLGGPAETPTPPPSGEQEIPTQDVFVALQPIPRGAQFVEGSIGRRPWPAQSVPPDVIQDPIETIGMVAKTEIVQGQIILRSMLAPVAGAGEASFKIPPGKVAVAFPIDRQTSVAYAIQPDDFVDILVTAHFLDVDEEFQTVLPNKMQFFFPIYDPETGIPIGFEVSEPATDEGRFEVAGDFSAIVYARHNQIPRRAAQLTVEAAKVIKVGLWLEEPAPPAPEGGDEEEQATPTPRLPDIVTLAVTPQDALVLLWLRQSGIYAEMALRSANEENADHLTEAVTLQYMLTRFNIAVPPKIEFIMASIEDLKELEIIVEQQQQQQTGEQGAAQ